MAEQTQSKVLWTLRNPYLWAMGLAVSYSALLLALPSGIGAFEIPNAQDLRDDVRGELCERFGARVCDDGAETDEGTGTGDGTDTGGSGGTGGGTSRDQVSMTIRTSDAVVTTDTLTLPRATAGDVRVTPTDGGSTVLVDARSVLAQLVAFDMESDEFAITDLQYYPAYESFFLNCITLAKGSEQCGQWQYAVNGEYPAVGLDKQILAGGDRVHLFFGSPRTVVSPRTVRPNEAFTVVVQEYDTKVGAYKPIGDYTVGVVQDNPADAWAPFEIATKTVNTKGEAMFTIATTGEYKIGIKEDSYYPTVPLTVSAGMSGGGGGAILRDDGPFDVPSARSFISGMQNADGSFSAPMYTDWAVIALVASGADTTKVRAYLMKDVAVLSSVTDYERRAMALMALGVSPYDGTSVNYIDAILARYGGLQIGDPALVNDDIFGLVVLTQAGYGVTDEVVQHVVAYLVHEQKANGSWEGSVDLTAAGIQALVPYRKVSGVQDTLIKAETYLRTQQKTDGGFGSSFATSWVLQAIGALGDSPSDWTKNSKTPLDSLATLQESDGGVESRSTADTTRLWATSYAIPAARGLAWAEVMQTFERPTTQMVSTTGGAVARSGGTNIASTTTATSTVATSAGVRTVSKDVRAPVATSSSPVRAVVNSTQSSVGDVPSVTPRIEVSGSNVISTSSIKSTSTDQLATAVGANGGTMSTALRLLTLIFAFALIAFGVFTWRKG